MREVNIGETITVAELAAQMSVKGAEVVKFMFKMGSPVTINQVLTRRPPNWSPKSWATRSSWSARTRWKNNWPSP